jgi:pantoate--beta-alanine ligase
MAQQNTQDNPISIKGKFFTFFVDGKEFQVEKSEITAGEIFREPDGLALSSRNGFFGEDERPLVPQLYRSLSWIKTEIESGRKDFIALEDEAREQISAAGFRPDYVSICNSRTLEPAAHDDAEITVLGAMYTRAARLIDNVSLVLGE